jgi:hypothetical protein
MATKWIYRIISLPDTWDKANKTLTNLGEEGWELVTIIHHSNAKEFWEDGGLSNYIAFFKMPS